jgi:hypothetical protein
MTESSDGKKREERAKRARQNGSKGRGPTSAAGAARSKLNGLTEGGLRAQTYPLPGEQDADAAAQAEWNACYRPASPAAVYHARQCARATVVADRAERFARARIADQKRKAVRNFRRRGPRRLKRILARPPIDRLGSFDDLACFSDGCDHLAAILDGAIEMLSSRGYLIPEAIETVVWAHGIGPVLQSMATDITAYKLYILNLGCTPGVAAAERDARLDPARRPLALRALPREALLPADSQVCHEQLRAMIQVKTDEYRAEADRLRKECDEPELARMLEEAEFLSDADAKRWQRCHAEQRLTFLRSEQALYKALERDREARDDRSDGPGPAGEGGFGESNDREEEATAAECAERAGDAAGTTGEGARLVDGPHPVFHRCAGTLPGGKRFSPREPRMVPEPPAQMMSRREHPTQEQGGGQGVPSEASGGAGRGQDLAPLPGAGAASLPGRTRPNDLEVRPSEHGGWAVMGPAQAPGIDEVAAPSVRSGPHPQVQPALPDRAPPEDCRSPL